MTGVEIGAAVIGGGFVAWWLRQTMGGGMKKDVGELKHFEEVLKKPPRIPRAQKLSELDDPYLSDSYVKKIIQTTNDKNELHYILDRVSNRTHNYLPNLVRKRLEEIENQEYIKIFIKTMKEKMPLSFDTIGEHFEHFI